MKPTTLIWGALLVLSGGCGGLSNEDLLFVGALPDDAILLDPPSESGLALANGQLQPLAEAARVSGHINDFTRKVLQSLRDALTESPERGAGMRRWGPFRWKKGFARLEMTLDASVTCEGESPPLAPLPRYRWSMAWAADKAGPYGVVVEGRTVGDAFEHSCGGLRFDLSEWSRSAGEDSDARLVDVAWSHESGQSSVLVDVSPRENAKGVLVGGVRYRYERGGLSNGLFRFALADDYLADSNGPERASVVMQWSPDRSKGRADWTILETATQAERVTGVLCWEKGRGEVYSRDDTGQRPVVGSEASCGFTRPDE